MIFLVAEWPFTLVEITNMLYFKLTFVILKTDMSKLFFRSSDALCAQFGTEG